jgi:hypothetical protein
VSTAFAHLSKAQVQGLVLWSAGIALTGSSGISQISALLSQVLEQKEGTVYRSGKALDKNHMAAYNTVR